MRVILICWSSGAVAKQGAALAKRSGSSFDLVHMKFMLGLARVQAVRLLLTVVI
jgi:hypothetical protein